MAYYLFNVSGYQFSGRISNTWHTYVSRLDDVARHLLTNVVFKNGNAVNRQRPNCCFRVYHRLVAVVLYRHTVRPCGHFNLRRDLLFLTLIRHKRHSNAVYQT